MEKDVGKGQLESRAGCGTSEEISIIRMMGERTLEHDQEMVPRFADFFNMSLMAFDGADLRKSSDNILVEGKD